MATTSDSELYHHTQNKAIELRKTTFSQHTMKYCIHVFADSASKIGKYCGSNADGGDVPQRRTYSAGNTLYVRFVTDATNQRTGFQFTFRIVGKLSLQGVGTVI